MISFAAQLRQELSWRNSLYATSHGLPHVCSYGDLPVTVYSPHAGDQQHGNFPDASYAAILSTPEWRKRLEKVHTQASRSLPKSDRSWRELDSCMSSDALLMNIFCHPQTLQLGAVNSMLGVDETETPVFGFPARVPLLSGRVDRTEVDMRIGSLLVESKLTESDFQLKAADIVESYRHFDLVFERKELPRWNGQYVSYQLIRNVLAAHALDLSFCVLLDSRRPDLLEAWYAVMKCVRIPELRTKCKVMTWQELSQVLPSDLQCFLDHKYGIVPPGQVPRKIAPLIS